jgi:hypothetical protein
MTTMGWDDTNTNNERKDKDDMMMMGTRGQRLTTRKRTMTMT